MYRKLLILVIVILCLPIILFVRILRPLVLIRFLYLQSGALGHASGIDIYISKKIQGKIESYDLFFEKQSLTDKSEIKNYFILNKWKEHKKLNIHLINYFLSIANRIIPGSKVHEFTLDTSERDIDCITISSPRNINFTKNEIEYGNKILKNLKLVENQYICFHNRDTQYQISCKGLDRKAENNMRDSSVYNYEKMTSYLFDKKYKVIRMGRASEKELELTNKDYFDYTKSNIQSDLLDFYLIEKSKFFVVSCTGINCIPFILRKATCYVNFSIIIHINISSITPNSIFIPKKIKNKKTNKFLTFLEMTKIYFIDATHKSFYGDKYKKDEFNIDINDLEFIENTPEEICEVVAEFNSRLDNTWTESKDDILLQENFWKIYPDNSFYKTSNIKIGSRFLKENQDLL